MRKYGIDNFSIELIESVKDSMADKQEIYWIKTLDTINNGCNLATGGRVNRGFKKSQKQIEVRRTIEKERYARGEGLAKWNGSKEQKNCVSKALTGRMFSDETRMKISLAKSQGMYEITVDGLKFTHTSIKGLAHILKVCPASLMGSYKHNTQVKSKGHLVSVKMLTV